MQLRAAVASDRGLVRQTNEDSYLVGRGLYAVCDGMGGARAGEVASEMACRELVSIDTASAGPQELRATIEDANLAIVRRSLEEERLFGMGTTLTAALVSGGSLLLAHVGDSRAYLMRDGSLVQLTSDHSWVAEMVRRGELTPAQAAVHPHRSVITRALGTEEGANPDIFEVAVESGDRVLLCSDGLTGMVSDEDIAEILRRDEDPKVVAELLVQAALAGGGEDNVTVVVLDVDRGGASGTEAPPDDQAGDQTAAVDMGPGGQPGDEQTAANRSGLEREAAADRSGAAKDRVRKRRGRTEAQPDADDEILLGPADRGIVDAAPAGRGRLSRAGVRGRFGGRVGPMLRPSGERSTGKGPVAAPGMPAVAAIAASGPADRGAAEVGRADQSITLVGAIVELPSVAATAPGSDAAPDSAGADRSVARPRRWTRRKWITVATIVVVALAIVVIGFAAFNSTVYYVGSSEGAVALYHGLPGSVLGIALSSVIERGNVTYDSLAPYLQARVDAHDLVSKEEGQLFLRSLSVQR